MRDYRVLPRPGQESVWDYPRPPRLEESSRLLKVEFAGKTIAETTSALRVLETSHPPTYYFPVEDVDEHFLFRGTRRSYCEFKGRAAYWDVRVGEREAQNAVWAFPRPAKSYEALAGMYAFYAGKMEACFVDGELVEPQMGELYGGWITSHVVGPFKGGGDRKNW